MTSQALLKKQQQSGNQLFSSEGAGTVLRHQFQGHSKHFSKVGVSKRGCLRKGGWR